MKFIKFNDAVWINPDKITVLKVLENEVWADDKLLTIFPTDTDAENAFDEFVDKLNVEK